jgi:glycine/D-amino acid oxidase-like deaminating enzyme
VILAGVLGGGLQGCCTAIALAARRVRVTLFDKNDALLRRAAIANEGKIHLGYMYAGDPSLSTAKTMMAGALAFAPFLDRYLGRPGHSFSLSVPATYIVHRDSQHKHKGRARRWPCTRRQSEAHPVFQAMQPRTVGSKSQRLIEFEATVPQCVYDVIKTVPRMTITSVA